MVGEGVMIGDKVGMMRAGVMVVEIGEGSNGIGAGGIGLEVGGIGSEAGGIGGTALVSGWIF